MHTLKLVEFHVGSANRCGQFLGLSPVWGRILDQKGQKWLKVRPSAALIRWVGAWVIDSRAPGGGGQNSSKGASRPRPFYCMSLPLPSNRAFYYISPFSVSVPQMDIEHFECRALAGSPGLLLPPTSDAAFIPYILMEWTYNEHVRGQRVWEEYCPKDMMEWGGKKSNKQSGVRMSGVQKSCKNDLTLSNIRIRQLDYGLKKYKLWKKLFHIKLQARANTLASMIVNVNVFTLYWLFLFQVLLETDCFCSVPGIEAHNFFIKTATTWVMRHMPPGWWN